ncbi:MAG: hypothetical protein U5S82_21730 [Gammaproteobacteria bacterium]|nr:hypothetical protein [Gammaproteobacteria bacterium]
MTPQLPLVLLGGLAAGFAAGTLWPVEAPGEMNPVAVAAQGIGPLRLGDDYPAAVAAARRVAPDSAFAGVGCNGLDEVRYRARLRESPVSVMGMAHGGSLAEIDFMLDTPTRAADEAACLTLRDDFARPFLARFGPAGEAWTVTKPVSTEHRLRVGPVVMEARWFPMGRSCYVSARYGAGV